ncbi:hypothetical protein H0H87_011625 [Tephrocybe sp. NHM501043]|nr:hypothetical protein H0H87_011625 [Tephrocybe sp. NHM501043]
METSLRHFLSGGTTDIFRVAGSALSLCSMAKALTIHVQNEPLPPSFTPFLQTLWKLIGPRLKKLKVKLTNVNLALLFDPEVARNLPNILRLEVDLSHPDVDGKPSIVTPSLQDTLVPFTKVLFDQLVSLTISTNLARVNGLALLFETIFFPKLRHIDIATSLAPEDHLFSPLLNFMRTHQAGLGEITIRRTSEYHPYMHDRFLNNFPPCPLPALRTLSIDTKSISRVVTGFTQHLQLFDESAPNLTSLLINDMSVDIYYLPLPLDSISPLRLTHVQLAPKFLSSHTIDHLLEIPTLEELHLSYWDYGPFAPLSSIKPLVNRFYRGIFNQ